ncbi:MAG: hypothetical protein EHM12_04510 [Dehalococcoidia bacterium]|nr:MAG: hypothetical protein EHM12_04510 [Dehalococcoidia bacterium]
MRRFSFLLVIILVTGLINIMVPDYSVQALAEQNIVTLPEITDFTVTPSNIDSGSAATLTWDIRNATSISIDHGIGNVSAKGQVQVNPLYSTTYKLSVSNGTGTRTRYITLNVEMPQPGTGDIVNVDPVTGRNSEVDLAWQDYCLSKEYQVQIARDPYFTLKVYDSGSMETADSLYPALLYNPGSLEAGHTYYWRVRVTQAATGQRILSQWSEPKSFKVGAGFATRADYASVHAFTPANGCTSCPVKPVSFSWSGYQDITKYRFLLAKDPQLQNIVVEAFTSTTSYSLLNALEYDTSYFWQVMAVEPIPSDSSAVFTFHTEPEMQTVVPQVSSSQSFPPLWAIIVMATGVLLIITAAIFIVRARPRI